VNILLKRVATWMLPTILLTLGLLLAGESKAASVYTCSQSGQQCVVRLNDGMVGDKVRVMDENARVVAEGRIVRRRGVYGIIRLHTTNKTIRKGYPVLVNVENSNSGVQWTASSSANHDER